MKMEIELLPMRVPNFVIQKTEARPRQEGMVEAPKYALKDIDPETLARLCDQFRADVFAKAEKPDPLANNPAEASPRQENINETEK